MQAMVYLVDDDASVRAALEDLLASVSLTVHSFPSIAAFLAHGVQHDTPACLVLDVRMPGQSGLDFAQSLHTHGLTLPVVFITGHGDVRMAVQAIKQGAVEFLTKPFRDQELLDAIYQAIEQDRQGRAQREMQTTAQARWQALSSGERAVLQGVVQGLLNKQIAHQLNLSEITIKVRRSQAMRKLQLRSVPELVRFYANVCVGADAPWPSVNPAQRPLCG